MKRHYSYVYLDDDQIDILYPQVFGDIIKRTIVKSDEEASDVFVKANLFNLLGSDVGNKTNNSTVENLEIITSAPRKAQLLIDHFSNVPIPSIKEIITKNSPFDESIHIVSRVKFELNQIYNKRTGDALLKETEQPTKNVNPLFIVDDDSLLVLESGNYDLHSNYLPYEDNKGAESDYGIVMHLSNSKMKKDVRHLTSMIRKGSSFNFFVFGELLQLNERYYRINPFAVWQ